MSAQGSNWLTMVNREPWVAEAACPTVDPEVFHPERGGSTREAKLVCASCVVQSQCLQWALENDEKWGVYGGYSEHERRRIRRGETPRPLPVPVERVTIRCEWCGTMTAGDRRFCTPQCSAAFTRARNTAGARRRRAAKGAA